MDFNKFSISNNNKFSICNQREKMRADITILRAGGEKIRWTSMTANWQLNRHRRGCSVNRAPVCHEGVLSSGQSDASATHPLTDQHATEDDGWMDGWRNEWMDRSTDGWMDGWMVTEVERKQFSVGFQVPS